MKTMVVSSCSYAIVGCQLKIVYYSIKDQTTKYPMLQAATMFGPRNQFSHVKMSSFLLKELHIHLK